MNTLVKEKIYLIPQIAHFLGEEKSIYKVASQDEGAALEQHLNDLYKFFLKELTIFEAKSYPIDADFQKISGLFETLLEVKRKVSAL